MLLLLCPCPAAGAPCCHAASVLLLLRPCCWCAVLPCRRASAGVRSCPCFCLRQLGSPAACRRRRCPAPRPARPSLPPLRAPPPPPHTHTPTHAAGVWRRHGGHAGGLLHRGQPRPGAQHPRAGLLHRQARRSPRRGRQAVGHHVCAGESPLPTSPPLHISPVAWFVPSCPSSVPARLPSSPVPCLLARVPACRWNAARLDTVARTQLSWAPSPPAPSLGDGGRHPGGAGAPHDPGAARALHHRQPPRIRHHREHVKAGGCCGGDTWGWFQEGP